MSRRSKSEADVEQRSAPRGRSISRLRTISETAEILQTSPRTVQRLIACKKLRAHHIGRLVRIEDADIAELLDATGSMI